MTVWVTIFHYHISDNLCPVQSTYTIFHLSHNVNAKAIQQGSWIETGLFVALTKKKAWIARKKRSRVGGTGSGSREWSWVVRQSDRNFGKEKLRRGEGSTSDPPCTFKPSFYFFTTMLSQVHLSNVPITLLVSSTFMSSAWTLHRDTAAWSNPTRCWSSVLVFAWRPKPSGLRLAATTLLNLLGLVWKLSK